MASVGFWVNPALNSFANFVSRTNISQMFSWCYFSHSVTFPIQLTSVSPDLWCPYSVNTIGTGWGGFSHLNSHLGAFIHCLPLTPPSYQFGTKCYLHQGPDIPSSNQIWPKWPFSNHSTCRRPSWEQGKECLHSRKVYSGPSQSPATRGAATSLRGGVSHVALHLMIWAFSPSLPCGQFLTLPPMP